MRKQQLLGFNGQAQPELEYFTIPFRLEHESDHRMPYAWLYRPSKVAPRMGSTNLIPTASPFEPAIQVRS